MMKSEFVKLLKEMSGNSDISDSNYKIIEHVYTFHPAIKDKKHMVALYLDYGMAVINDMVCRANKCAELETKIHQAENELEVLKNQLMELNDF